MSNQTSFSEFMSNGQLKGLSAGVYEKGKWKNTYLGVSGNIAPYSNILVSPNSIYDLASLTKVIGTTTRTLQLIQDNKLSFDSKINELIEEYPNLTMSIEELLFHRSGLMGDYPDKSNFSSENLYHYLEEVQIGNKSLCYSDLGFMLLGFIIESLDRTSLCDSFQKNIFNPLKMTNTTYVIDRHNLNNYIPTEYHPERGLIVGQVHDSKAYKMGKVVGSAGLFSTLEDVEKFTSSLLCNHYPDGSHIFNQEIFHKLTHLKRDGRYLGWENKYGENVLFHTGFTGTSIGLDIANKRALVLLTNRIHPSRDNSIFLEKREELYSHFFNLS